MLRLFDTAKGRVEELALRQPGQVSMYVCGPTVDNLPHLGHGRMSLVFDVLRRYLEWSGLQVDYVSNITDVDDKIIARAAVEGRSTEEVAAEYEGAWYAAMDALGVRRPTADPHATAYIDAMVALVADLVTRGHAYETADGVYLAVDSVPGYGLLARQSLESLKAGARVGIDDEKRSPVDFALWKKREDDDGSTTWGSPWGPGRPGWHTECVVMALDLLGDGFDLHGGGLDLAFPHHENERAQAVAMGRRFSSAWVHNGIVVDERGEKMSKSLGNVSSLSDLVQTFDPRAYRLLVLQSHYRSPMQISADTIIQAERTLATLDALARRAVDAGIDPAAVTPDDDARAAFVAAMDDDLGTHHALAGVFDLVRRANTLLDAGDTDRAASLVAAVVDLTGALGLELRAGGDEVDEASAALVVARDAARAARDWAEADRLRDELKAAGWVVEDTPAGTRVHR